MKLSVIVPIYNEAENIPELWQRLQAVLEEHWSGNYEVIAVNDGSTDKSWFALQACADRAPELKGINFLKNYGQTAALAAGIERATGDIVVPIDGDLENDPTDIPRLIATLEEGYDVVSGWRKHRWQGNWLTRKMPSFLANLLISSITGVYLHDYGCTLKSYRREIIAGVPLYGEMHRFIPAYASWKGARVTEQEVSYAPRRHGVSKYGISRTFRVALDLILLKFLTKYMDRPMHFFGGIGFVLLALGFLSGLAAVILKLAHLRDFVATPLPVFTALFLIVGVQLVVMGIIAEMLMRIYYEFQQKRPYSIKETVNL